MSAGSGLDTLLPAIPLLARVMIAAVRAAFTMIRGRKFVNQLRGLQRESLKGHELPLRQAVAAAPSTPKPQRGLKE